MSCKKYEYCIVVVSPSPTIFTAVLCSRKWLTGGTVLRKLKLKCHTWNIFPFTEIKISSFMKEKLFSLIFLENKSTFLKVNFMIRISKMFATSIYSATSHGKQISVYMKLLMKLILQA